MKHKKTLILLATHLAAVCIGSLCAMYFMGWWVRDSINSANNMLHGGTLVNRYALYADLQRAYGSPEEYREVLLSYLKAVDDAKKQYPDDFLFTDTIYYTEKTMVYTRLARLLEDQPVNSEGIDYKKMATETCNKIPWDSCSYEHLKSLSIRLDEKSTFNSNSDAK